MLVLSTFIASMLLPLTAARSDVVATIRPHAYTSWGDWGSAEYCPDGQFVFGFRLKVEEEQGGGDDTAVNAIELKCRQPWSDCEEDTITSETQVWGDWTGYAYCSDEGSFVKSIVFRSEEPNSDDTALNNMNMVCDKDNQVLYGQGLSYGDWLFPAVECPAGSVVCGLKTLVEDFQWGGDDTAVNTLHGDIYIVYKVK